MATPIFRVTVQPGGIALPAPGQQRRSVAAGRVSTSPTSALADAQAAANESDSDDGELTPFFYRFTLCTASF